MDSYSIGIGRFVRVYFVYVSWVLIFQSRGQIQSSLFVFRPGLGEKMDVSQYNVRTFMSPKEFRVVMEIRKQK